MLTTAQWIVSWITAIYVVFGLYFIWTSLSGPGISGGTIGPILAQCLAVLWTLFKPTINKFHLLWLVPLSYPVGIFFGIFFNPFSWPKSLPIYATVGIYVVILYFLGR